MSDQSTADGDRDIDALAADLVARAQAVADELRPRAAATEKNRRIPEENFGRICEEGLLTVIQSRRCGGHELSMRAHLDIVASIAEGCGSTSWVLGSCTPIAG